jgi:aerotolerance regulator-like protein
VREVIWLNATGLIAFAAVALPVLIHLFTHQRAERLAFPTLRFLKPTQLAAMRRRTLEDAMLVVVRSLTLAAAAAALAGPVLVTHARREEWNQRIVEAVATDRTQPVPDRRDLHTREIFRGDDLADAIRRAVAWLEHAPPARRELLVVSPLQLGSITSADLASVPADVGLAFERAGELPPSRTVPFGRVLSSSGARSRDVVLDGDRTSVVERPAGDVPSVSFSIETIAPADAKPIVDAAIAAVRSRRVWAAPPDRHVRLVVLPRETIEAQPIRRVWMSVAVDRLTRDPDLRAAAAQATAVSTGSRQSGRPWHVVAVGGDGRAIVTAAESSGALLVSTRAPAASMVTPALIAALANAIAVVPDLLPAEVMTIPDAQLRAWSRPASTPMRLRTNEIDANDRRGFWIGALVLLGIEAWIRRGRREAAPDAVAERGRVA